MIIVCDIEADDIKATRIHVLSYQHGKELKTLTSYDEMRALLRTPNLIVIGHNFIRYDRPTLERILGEKFNFKVYDTLGISWYLYQKQLVHGLEEWGEMLGVPKVQITSDQWKGLTDEERVQFESFDISSQDYDAHVNHKRLLKKHNEHIALMKERCETDVRINVKLWIKQKTYLDKIYDNKPQRVARLLDYITDKLEVIAEQEEIGVKIDIPRAQESLNKFQLEYDKKVEQLSAYLPEVPQYSKKDKPKNMYKKDGSLSAHGEKWVQFLDLHGVEYQGVPIKYVSGYVPANAGSTDQIKNYLFSIGWVPEWYKDSELKDGSTSSTPQIKNKDDDKKGEVCDSIKSMFADYPHLEILEGMGILKHRIGILKGFIENVDEKSRLYPTLSSFTNTFRLKHKVIVNLPKVSLFGGEEIRGCLVADDGDLLCGTDLSNIESRTRDHYIFPYDPTYVAEMSEKGFDSHMDIAVAARLIHQSECEFYKWWSNKKKGGYVPKEKYYKNFGIKFPQYTLEQLLALPVEEQDKIAYSLAEARPLGKKINFSAVYGVGAPKLSLDTGFPQKFCKELLNAYWERNKSVRLVSESWLVKEVDGQKWILNPVSGFYLQLRADKDRFSTTNQSSAVYVFDRYVHYARKEHGIKVGYQCHDEFLFNLNGISREEVEVKLKAAMQSVNDELKLNVVLGSSLDVNYRYSDCH